MENDRYTHHVNLKSSSIFSNATLFHFSVKQNLDLTQIKFNPSFSHAHKQFPGIHSISFFAY
jgi:hypothetical protein